jgi:type I restriction enzyme S subunit
LSPWPAIELGKVAEIAAGGSAPQDPDDFSKVGIPFVRAGSLKPLIEGAIVESSLELLSEDVAKKHRLRLFPAGSVLFAKSGMSATKGLVYRLTSPAYVVNHLAAVIAGPNLDSGYLRHCLQVFSPTCLIQDEAYPSIRLSDITLMKIPLPPLDEQKKIADILDRAEALRAKRRAALAQLDELVQSIFIEMFGDPMKNPRGFNVVKLSEVSEVSSGLTLNSQRRSKKENLFPYLRVANVFRNKLDLSEIKYIHISDSETNKYMLKKDDVLIVEGHGNIEEIGRTAVWKGEIANCAHQNHIIKVRLDENYMRPYFASYFLNLYGNKGYFYYKSRTTSGLNTISTNKVRDVEIFLPPIDTQLMFEKIVLEIERRQQSQQQSLLEINNLFDALLHEAFTGKLFSNQFFDRKIEKGVKI